MRAARRVREGARGKRPVTTPIPRPRAYLTIFSRYVVGWMVATCESAALAEKLIAATCAKQGITLGQLSIHADGAA